MLKRAKFISGWYPKVRLSWTADKSEVRCMKFSRGHILGAKTSFPRSLSMERVSRIETMISRDGLAALLESRCGALTQVELGPPEQPHVRAAEEAVVDESDRSLGVVEPFPAPGDPVQGQDVTGFGGDQVSVQPISVGLDDLLLEASKVIHPEFVSPC